MIEILPRDKKYRTQEKAITHHNERKEIMLSVPDALEVKDSQINEIQKDWKGWSYQVTSTRIDYSKNTITHHVDSKVVKPKVIKLKSIPICTPTYLNNLISNSEGLTFVRALCNNMKLSKKEIIAKFQRVTGKSQEQIRFWTPTESERKKRPIRSVGLYFGGSEFILYAYVWVDYGSGFSRGVIIILMLGQKERR